MARRSRSSGTLLPYMYIVIWKGKYIDCVISEGFIHKLLANLTDFAQIIEYGHAYAFKTVINALAELYITNKT